jgi:two-component system, OmpR family, sensor histidine kinase MprB
MSFRTRLALVAAAAVGIAVVAASVVVFVVVHNELFGEVDRALHQRAVEINEGPAPVIDEGFLRIPGPRAGVQSEFVQAVPIAGPARIEFGAKYRLPVTAKDRETARGENGLYYSNRRYANTEFRVLTIPAPPYAVQIARPLSEVNRTLHRITLFLIVIAVGGIAVAAALGLLVARAALTPVRRLTETTEAVTETRDLSQRIESTSTGDDELGRLATSFNTMLGALEDSSRAQRQLVADASHELRTPLTSLKTNIEVLARGNELSPETREQLLHDLVEQIDEMTALIGELIELAREARPDAVAEPARDVRLDLVAADAIERTRRNRPGIEFETDLDESIVYGAPSTIERAVANLLDNAAKWSPPGGQVEVAVRHGELSVRDHGPGIADEDLPYVFDRFYRSRTARGLPGSGLGLAIVKQVAESHGGSVVVERPQGGGTLMRLRLNGRGRAS